MLSGSSVGRLEVAPSWAAARSRLGLVALLVAAAGASWWWTAGEMRGMDDGPGTPLGSLGWFVGVWVLMTAAMMFPSASPTVALYARMTRRRAPLAPLVFVSGYLVAWTAAGLAAFGVSAAGRSLLGAELAWRHGGRWLAGTVLLAAAAFELTPLKDVCLTKCRSPLGFLLGSWRDGLRGALLLGARHGGWCVACCWALMASLFALGVMSVAWMAFVAALIAAEKTLPWRRPVTYATALLLALLAILVVAAPGSVPGLHVPGGGTSGRMG
jgi:predicted metal-binding membrane protein